MPAKPDALMIDGSKKSGDNLYARIDSVCTLAESLLGLDRAKGESAHLRSQPGGKTFATASNLDTLNYPYGHPKEGHGPRYNWVPSDDPAIEYGYLKDKPETPTEPTK